jgi:hypothetical protein
VASDGSGSGSGGGGGGGSRVEEVVDEDTPEL